MLCDLNGHRKTSMQELCSGGLHCHHMDLCHIGLCLPFGCGSCLRCTGNVQVMGARGRYILTLDKKTSSMGDILFHWPDEEVISSNRVFHIRTEMAILAYFRLYCVKTEKKSVIKLYP